MFASPKGGVGKSTAAVLLASEFASHGGTVTMIYYPKYKVDFHRFTAMVNCGDILPASEKSRDQRQKTKT